MSETPREGDGSGYGYGGNGSGYGGTTPGGPPPSGDRPDWGSAYPAPTPGGGFPPPPGMQGYPPVRKHNDATTAMVLGIVSLAGAFMCVLPVLIAPFAWYLGAKATREIEASNGAIGGRGEASAGKVLGIIGTVLLALAIAGVILLVVLTFTVDDFWADDYESYDAVFGVLGQALSAG
jgi:hypothetical protein